MIVIGAGEQENSGSSQTLVVIAPATWLQESSTTASKNSVSVSEQKEIVSLLTALPSSADVKSEVHDSEARQIKSLLCVDSRDVERTCNRTDSCNRRSPEGDTNEGSKFELHLRLVNSRATDQSRWDD